MNPRLKIVTESPTVNLTDRIREMKRTGNSILELQAGDPDFKTHPVIIKAAFDAMNSGMTHYCPSRGLPDLRSAISEKLFEENKISADPDSEILVTHGAAHALFLTMQTLLSPGDEVLLIEPYYRSYESSVKLAGGIPVPVKTNPRNGFRINFDDLTNAVSKNTRLIIINNPANPTGNVLTSAEIDKIANFIDQYNLYAICDEVYEKIIYNNTEHFSLGNINAVKNKVITINSFSKSFAMTGWRLGYLSADKDIVKEMLKVLQYSATNIAPFSQQAAFTALTDSQSKKYVKFMRQKYEERLTAGINLIKNISKIDYLAPQGAFYLMLNISNFESDSIKFANNLLKNKMVGVVPGSVFGESSEGWVRLSFSVSKENFIQGIKLIESFSQWTDC